MSCGTYRGNEQGVECVSGKCDNTLLIHKKEHIADVLRRRVTNEQLRRVYEQLIKRLESGVDNVYKRECEKASKNNQDNADTDITRK